MLFFFATLKFPFVGKSMFFQQFLDMAGPQLYDSRYLDVYISICVFICCIYLYIVVMPTSICLYHIKSICLYLQVCQSLCLDIAETVTPSDGASDRRISSIKKCTSLLPMNFECGVPLLRSTMNRILLCL